MKEDFVTLTIDEQEVKVKKGTTILQAAKQVGDRKSTRLNSSHIH